MESWEYLRAELVEPFDRQGQHLLGKPLTANGGWKDELFSVLRESIEMTATQRGVERWHLHCAKPVSTQRQMRLIQPLSAGNRQ